jgi:hypothetical protein
VVRLAYQNTLRSVHSLPQHGCKYWHHAEWYAGCYFAWRIFRGHVCLFPFSARRTPLMLVTHSLYGIMCVQCYVFFQRFTQEGKPLKYAVRVVCQPVSCLLNGFLPGVDFMVSCQGLGRGSSPTWTSIGRLLDTVHLAFVIHACYQLVAYRLIGNIATHTQVDTWSITTPSPRFYQMDRYHGTANTITDIQYQN